MGRRESSSTLSHTETLHSPSQPSSSLISLITQPFLPDEIKFSHTETLRHLIDVILFWIKFSNNFSAVQQSDLEVVCDHASVLGGIRAFMEKNREDQTSYANLDLVKEFWTLTTEGRNKFVETFLRDLKEAFEVPKLDRRRNVEVANFMGFLVKLLIGKPYLFDSDPDPVITDLRSFNTILLDTPFQSTQNHSEVQTLLSQFESLANHSGGLVYSFLFSSHPPPIKKIDEILSEHITLLKDNVNQFLNSPSYIITAPNTLQFPMFSVFVVDSFLDALESLLIREDNSILKNLRQSLEHSWSLLNEHHEDTDDQLKQVVMLAFDAEYLVTLFLCGDAPGWYFTLRIRRIIHCVDLVVDELLQAGDNFSAGQSLLTRKNHGLYDLFRKMCLKIALDDKFMRVADGWVEWWKGGRESICPVNIPFSISDLEVVPDHASILGIRVFMAEKIRNQSYENLDPIEKFMRSHYRWVVTFLEDLEEAFKVPKLDRRRNVQVANFMGFLVKLLIGEQYLFASDPDTVITDLRSFNTILLDSPFQSTQNHSEVETLLSQFESLANQSGRLVHSFLFSSPPPPIKKIDELLSEPITLLKNNVIQFFNSPSYINTTPNTFQFAMSLVFIVDSVLHDLENLMNREDNSILEVKDDVEKLHQSLKHSWSLLNKQHDERDELKQIVMLAFDAEYLVNHFLCGDAPAWYLALRLPQLIHSVELVGSRLQEMVMENHVVNRVLQVGDDFDAGVSLQTGTNSKMDEIMVGFEEEEQKILGDLVGKGKGLQIISIIGMPGIGKTTLAKKMYNHPAVRDRFDRISRCVVSQAYKKKKLLVEILMGLDADQVKESTLAGESEDEVGRRIHKTLKGQRYFIVVDDIWEFSPWEGIHRYFPDDRNYSRILFTSRNEEVADQYNSIIHALPPLSNDQCWELLQKKVFKGESCPPELQHTGAKIAAQCNGLPLVVVAVSGILLTEVKDLSAWENVRQTLDSYILSYQDRAIAKSLELSYIYLPHKLKPCFLYFGRFREDEQIIVKEVVRLWIAEGFIPVDKKKRSEDIAKEYMNELIGKNLVMVAKKNYKGEAKVCTMHDLLRDMCLKIVEDDNFMTVVNRFQPYSKYLKYSLILEPIERFSSLEFLILDYFVRISSSILNATMKLRYLRAAAVHLDIDCNTSRIYKLEYISKVRISKREDVEQLKVFPHIRRLVCDMNVESGFIFDICFFIQLESLTLEFRQNWREMRIVEIAFPSSIIKLTLQGGLRVSSEQMSIIGASLPNLEVLKLNKVDIGEKWETRDDEFQKLVHLKLAWIEKLVEWNVSWEHFPVLERLIINYCSKLKEVPSEIGCIETLQVISVIGVCTMQLKKSVDAIKEQMQDEGNEDVTIQESISGLLADGHD